MAAHARSAGAADRVRARLAAANSRWDVACTRAHAWQRTLQHALLHNRQFHDAVVELVARLAAAERAVRAREPLRLGREPNELQRDFRRFAELRDELRRAEPRVLALHDAAALLAPGAPPHSRLAELRLRLQSLRKLCAVYALKLGAALARRPASAAHALAAAAALAGPAAPTVRHVYRPPFCEFHESDRSKTPFKCISTRRLFVNYGIISGKHNLFCVTSPRFTPQIAQYEQIFETNTTQA